MVKGIWLSGNWRAGWALDYYSSSIGSQLSRLKYRDPPDWRQVEPLAEAAADFLKTRKIFQKGLLSVLFPVPPSKSRSLQPVEVLADRIGEKTGLLVSPRYLIKVKKTPPLRSVEDRASRRVHLRGAFRVRDQSFVGKSVLLFDDVYRSGETLREVTRILYKEGRVRSVYVLVIAKTTWRR
jgi:predicted amidophosphoribosyltransferase